MWQNPETKRKIILYGCVTLAAWAAGTWFLGRQSGLALLVLCLLFDGLMLADGCVRDRRMRRLSDQIDAILHGKGSLDLASYAEGELSILENELSKMTTRLWSQADQLQKEKNNLADSLADISHQLRTPLTSINLMITRLADSSLPEKDRRILISELRGMLDRVDWLITSLLKLSRFDAGTVKLERKAVSVSELVRQAAAPLLIPLELRELELKVMLNGDETYTGDLAWTVEALGNVMKNCMEHTPAGGRIEVRAAENAVYTEITVRDTGTGIAAEDLPRLFERFYKGKNSGSGFGIGLALARTIISRQNGTIKAENHREGGAVFTIRFYKSTI